VSVVCVCLPELETLSNLGSHLLVGTSSSELLQNLSVLSHLLFHVGKQTKCIILELQSASHARMTKNSSLATWSAFATSSA